MANDVEVTQNGCFLTLRVGSVMATREYSDPWCAKRNAELLLVNQKTRENFFRKLLAKKRERVTKEELR